LKNLDNQRDVFAEFPFLRSVVDYAKTSLKPTRVILFGSRARGVHHDLSDVDLAFVGVDPSKWGRFVADFSEHSGSLLHFDLINLDESSDEMLRTVSAEGVTIYES
jgi:predicted nucleotidyltransferase